MYDKLNILHCAPLLDSILGIELQQHANLGYSFPYIISYNLNFSHPFMKNNDEFSDGWCWKPGF